MQPAPVLPGESDEADRRMEYVDLEMQQPGQLPLGDRRPEQGIHGQIEIAGAAVGCQQSRRRQLGRCSSVGGNGDQPRRGAVLPRARQNVQVDRAGIGERLRQMGQPGGRGGAGNQPRRRGAQRLCCKAQAQRHLDHPSLPTKAHRISINSVGLPVGDSSR